MKFIAIPAITGTRGTVTNGSNKFEICNRKYAIASIQ
jgi:hypothetical protein